MIRTAEQLNNLVNSINNNSAIINKQEVISFLIEELKVTNTTEYSKYLNHISLVGWIGAL